MAYHLYAEIVPSRLTEDEMVQLTNDTVGGEEVVTAVYEDMRADAEAEIDGYLGARYALPLSETPALVKRLSLTLTIHALYQRRFAEAVPEGIRSSYTDAVRILNRLSDGTMTLGLQPAAAPNSERVAVVSTHDRVFSRSKLAGF